MSTLGCIAQQRKVNLPPNRLGTQGDPKMLGLAVLSDSAETPCWTLLCHYYKMERLIEAKVGREY